jgi:glycosyltransferase involved in cell wall biosynthesis
MMMERKRQDAKRILFIGLMGQSEVEGCDVLWTRTAAEFIRRGAVVIASVRHDDKPMAEHLRVLERLGAEIHIRDKVIIKKSFLSRFAEKISKELSKLRPEGPYVWISQSRPNLVVISQPGPLEGVELMEACSRFAIPYVTITHLVSEAIWAYDVFLDRLSLALQKAKKCFFVSRANLELMQIQLGGVHLKNHAIVRNPFNVSYDARPEWPAGDIYRLLCLGRLRPFAKGQDILFQVMNMKKWRDRPVDVVCIGKGLNADSVQRLKIFFDLKNVEVLSFDDNVECLWSQFHALVLPSRCEGLPLVIVEAMLCGRVCIVTDVAGNKELLEDGVTGFIAKAPTVELFDEAMERAWQKRHQWREMGQDAAIAVRKVIPRHPESLFCDKLLGLMATLT